MDIVSLALAKKFTQNTIDPLGNIKGAPCTIKEVVETDENSIITFEWTDTDGNKQTETITVKNGINGIDGQDGEDGQDGLDGESGVYPIIETSETTVELFPNRLYKFGEVASLSITFSAETDSTHVNEYMFEFISGATATTLTLPDSIKWVFEPIIEANKTYQISIINDVGIIVGA